MGWLKGSVKLWLTRMARLVLLLFFSLKLWPLTTARVVVVVFLGHKAAGILAEGAHLVAPGRRVADELALVEHLVDGFHDLVAALHPHADVHRAGLWAMPCSAQSFSSQSAPRRPVAMTTCLPSTSRGPSSPAGSRLAYRAVQDNVLALGLKSISHRRPAGGSGCSGRAAGPSRCPGAGWDSPPAAAPALDGPLADGLDLLALVDALHLGVGTEFQIDSCRCSR